MEFYEDEFGSQMDVGQDEDHVEKPDGTVSSISEAADEEYSEYSRQRKAPSKKIKKRV